MEPAPRFEWERIMSRNDWERLIRALPLTSPLLAHRLCGKPSRCRRPNGSMLHPKTIKATAYALATWAKPDGTDAHPGIGAPRLGEDGKPCEDPRGMMLSTLQSKPTVIAGLRHLETVGLVMVHRRGGAIGLPRHHATTYCLTAPPLEQIVATAVDADVVPFDGFRRHDPGPG